MRTAAWLSMAPSLRHCLRRFPLRDALSFRATGDDVKRQRQNNLARERSSYKHLGLLTTIAIRVK